MCFDIEQYRFVDCRTVVFLTVEKNMKKNEEDVAIFAMFSANLRHNV